MNRFVLDASVAVAWVAAVPADPYAKSVQTFVQNGWHAMVPALWLTEVANALLSLERRKVLTRADVDSGLLDLQTFLDAAAEIDQRLISLTRLADSARGYQLTVYDGLYLELARRERVPLATLDSGMRAAAVKAGVSLLK